MSAESEIDCPHGLDARWCSICLKGPSGILPKRERPERVIPARFASTCARCGQSIDEGQRIGLVDDEWLCCFDGAA